MLKAAWAALFLLGAVFLAATGAALTSLHGQPDLARMASVHCQAAFTVAGVGTILFVWLIAGGPRPAMFLTLAILSAGFADGWIETNLVADAAIHAWHAWLAALVTAGSGVLAWAVSPAFRAAPELVEDHGWPSLRSMTVASVILLMAQIGLGAAYRHDLAGLIPHLFGAPVVALVVILAASFVVQQFPRHGSLRPMAIAVLVVTSGQVALGLITLVTGMTQTVLTRGALWIRVAHVVNGSLTLAATLVLAIEIRRKVRRAVEP